MSLWGGGASGGSPIAARFLETDSVPHHDTYEDHLTHAVHYDYPSADEAYPMHLYDKFGRRYTLMPDFETHDDYLPHREHEEFSHYHPFDTHHPTHDYSHHGHQEAHGPYDDFHSDHHFDPLDHL